MRYGECGTKILMIGMQNRIAEACHNSVGKIFPTMYKYYDTKTHSVKVKSRPALIIFQPLNERDTEYIVLPCSTIKNPSFLNEIYDVPLSCKEYPKTHIVRDCYIRCHKQTIMYRESIDFEREIADLKNDYEKTFAKIMAKVYEFQTKVVETTL